jgi:hypothetical protein
MAIVGDVRAPADAARRGVLERWGADATTMIDPKSPYLRPRRRRDAGAETTAAHGCDHDVNLHPAPLEREPHERQPQALRLGGLLLHRHGEAQPDRDETARTPSDSRISIFGRSFIVRLVTQMHSPGNPLLPCDSSSTRSVARPGARGRGKPGAELPHRDSTDGVLAACLRTRALPPNARRFEVFARSLLEPVLTPLYGAGELAGHPTSEGSDLRFDVHLQRVRDGVL